MSRPRPRGVGGSANGGCLGPGPGPGGRWEVSRPRPGGVQAQAWGCVSQHALRQTPHTQTATAADDTYPAGMHSCYYFFSFMAHLPKIYSQQLNRI